MAQILVCLTSQMSSLQYFHEDCIKNSASRRRLLFHFPMFHHQRNVGEGVCSPGKEGEPRSTVNRNIAEFSVQGEKCEGTLW